MGSRVQITYYVERYQSIKFPRAVHIAEQDSERKPKYVNWISEKMTKNFDELGKEDPKQKSKKGVKLHFRRPRARGLVRQVHEESVNDKGPASQGREVDSICTPGLLSAYCITNQYHGQSHTVNYQEKASLPNVSFDKHASQITSPITASPAQYL